MRHLVSKQTQTILLKIVFEFVIEFFGRSEDVRKACTDSSNRVVPPAYQEFEFICFLNNPGWFFFIGTTTRSGPPPKASFSWFFLANLFLIEKYNGNITDFLLLPTELLDLSLCPLSN